MYMLKKKNVLLFLNGTFSSSYGRSFFMLHANGQTGLVTLFHRGSFGDSLKVLISGFVFEAQCERICQRFPVEKFWQMFVFLKTFFYFPDIKAWDKKKKNPGKNSS